MAVKVMWARAIREEKASAPTGSGVAAPVSVKACAPVATAVAQKGDRAKRRRSSVYDADGNEVFITLVCLKCQKTRPLSQFGLRKMADGAIRNQPWCKGCRAESAAKSPRKSAGGTSETGDSPVSGEPLASRGAPPASGAPSAPAAAGNLAAQIAAALNAGRR